MRNLFLRLLGTCSATLLLLWAAPGRADDQTRAAQTTLAAKGFFFGTPDGHPGPATTEALRRFQIREGLSVSGDLDAPTSRALGLSAPETPKTAAPPASSTSSQPPPAGDSDRDFLRQNGLTPNATPPPKPRATPTPRPAARPAATPAPPPVPPPDRPRPPRAESPAEQNVFTNAPPPPARRNLAGPAISPAEAAQFVRRYLAAGAGDDPGAELAFFADEVNYFNNGRVGRRFLNRDQIAYRRRWPFRRYELAGDPQLVNVSPDGLATVAYRLRFQVESPNRVSRGTTEGEIVMRRVPGGAARGFESDFEIVAIHERASGGR